MSKNKAVAYVTEGEHDLRQCNAQLTAANERCAKAYELLKDRNDCDTDNDDNDTAWNGDCDEWIADYRLTLPAAEREDKT